MRMRCLVGVGFALLVSVPASADVLLTNGLVGDGRWDVTVAAGGESRNGVLDPTGPAVPTNVLFDYFHYVQVGTGTSTQLSATNIIQDATSTGPNQVTSSGSFTGQNGTINWSAVSSIAPGSPVYETALSFTSANPFGDVRVIQYLDEDVYAVGDDNLIVFGTSGQPGFELLTIDGAQNVGVSQSAGFASAQNMTYLGWAARPYSQLKSAISGGTVTFVVGGAITNLAPVVDPRYPTNTAYGPADITSAIAFQLIPNATSASVTLALGGSPSGAPVIPPETEPEPEEPPTVPEPASLTLLALGAAGLFSRRMRTRA